MDLGLRAQGLGPTAVGSGLRAVYSGLTAVYSGLTAVCGLRAQGSGLTAVYRVPAGSSDNNKIITIRGTRIDKGCLRMRTGKPKPPPAPWHGSSTAVAYVGERGTQTTVSTTARHLNPKGTRENREPKQKEGPAELWRIVR